jgi:amidohydrolase
MDNAQRELIERIDSLRQRLILLSDSICREPELGLNEFKTSALLKGVLREHGLEIREGIAGMQTAFSASFGGNSPRIALFAEMDALPGIGHGCGHNISAVASVGAIIALKECLSGKGMNGTVTLLGTPAEELGIGKIEMIKAGVFKDIDCAMMVHASSKRTVEKRFLGLTRLNIAYIGRASHAAAYPQEGINALDAVILMFNSINALRQHITEDCRIHGIITNGGKAPNIIPDRAEAVLYVRAKDMAGLQALKEKVIRSARAAAMATGADVQIREVGDTNAPMKINKEFADVYRRSLRLLGIEESKEPSEKNLGSSDIGNVSQIVPTIHPHVPIRQGINIHTPEFAEATMSQDGHNALMEGAKCLGLTAIGLLTDKDALLRIAQSFKAGDNE